MNVMLSMALTTYVERIFYDESGIQAGRRQDCDNLIIKGEYEYIFVV